MQVFLDGEKIFDRKEEGGAYPEVTRVRKMKEIIAAKIDAAPVHAH